MIRKHSARCLKILSSVNGKEEWIHFVAIGGRCYYNGRSSIVLNPKLSNPDGFWTDSIKTIVEERVAFTLKEVFRGYKPTKAFTYIREWTSDQAVYGVPF